MRDLKCIENNNKPIWHTKAEKKRRENKILNIKYLIKCYLFQPSLQSVREPTAFENETQIILYSMQ